MDDRLYQELIPFLDMPTKPDGQGRIWSYCPMHGDGKKHGKGPGTATNPRGRSLSLHPRLGLKCFGGDCTPSSDAQAFKRMLDALGYQPGERKPTPIRKAKPDTTGARQVAVYEYRYPNGELAAVKARYEYPDPASESGMGKTFKWKRPGQNWDRGLHTPECGDPCTTAHAATLPLWNAEKVAAAPLDVPVWFVEGEKACDALTAQGELAVTWGGGASARVFGDALEVLRGHPVRLWPDNDETGLAFMAHIRKELHGIARSVITVMPPCKPKEDAFDYFASGRQLVDVLDGILTDVAVDVINDASFRVRIPVDGGQAVFTFEDMEQTRLALDCELTVTLLTPINDAEPYTTRINLKSSSGRSGIETALGRQFGKGNDLNWTRLVNTAWNRATAAYKLIPKGALVSDLPEPLPNRWLIRNVIPQETTLIFGDGGAGKSYNAIAIGSAIATGGSYADIPATQTSVLYLDWETPGRAGEGEFRRRCERVWRGMGLDDAIFDSIPFYYWGARGAPLQQDLKGIEEFVRAKDIGFIIIDSAMPACGGEPEKADVALGFFGAINRIGVPTLVLSHVPKEGMKDGKVPDRAYGSQVWHNGPRMTFLQHRADEGSSPTITFGLYCKKANNGPKPPALGLRMNLGGGFYANTPITFERYEVADDPALAGQLDLWVQCRNLLQDRNFAPSATATTGELANELGKTPKEIFEAMNARRAHRGNGERGVFRSGGGHDRTPEQRWMLNAQEAS